MSYLPIFIIIIVVYVLCIRFALSDSKRRTGMFAVVNIAAFTLLSLLANSELNGDGTIFSFAYLDIARHIFFIGFYVLLISGGFFLMRAFSKRENWLPWAAFFYPIAVLIVIKYLPFTWSPLLAQLNYPTWIISTTFIGLSYMAFRLSYLVLEVRNDVVPKPTLSEYLGFAFFLPTMVVGPINPYSTHQRSIQSADTRNIQNGRCLLRIVVGATKYLFLGNLVNQLSYTGIFYDDRSHGFFDLAVAIVSYYLFLYLNFSGFCDMAIGLGGLVGVRVKENFDNPFAARNVKEFWNRWHITLSEYTRDVIFSPVSKALIKKLGVSYANFSISASIFLVFTVIGIWHGVGWRFVIFGIIHAVGIVVNHYYTLRLKRTLGKEKYKAYNENPLVNAAAIVGTFCYVALSFSVFANDYNMVRVLWYGLRTSLGF